MGKKLRKNINLFLSLLIIVVLLPLLATLFFQQMQLNSLIGGILSAAGTGTEALGEGGRGRQAEEQVVGILAKEISANQNREAILAQCVIARTSLYDAWRTGNAEPEGLSIEEMQKLWGEDFQKIYQSMEECAAITQGEVLTWNGSCIYAAYHALSAGKTRNMSELYEEADMPYLTETLCKEDTAADGYLAVLYWGKNEFLSLCAERFPDSAPQDVSQIEIAGRDSAGYVTEVRVGGVSYTGEDFRSRFELNSSCFALTDLGEQVRIVTKGLGHGFGLSQNTAELMAADGKSYKEILQYFYPGAKIEAAENSN